LRREVAAIPRGRDRERRCSQHHTRRCRRGGCPNGDRALGSCRRYRDVRGETRGREPDPARRERLDSQHIDSL
jgi:hypothetical protein